MGNLDATGTCDRHMRNAMRRAMRLAYARTDGRTDLRRILLNLGTNRTFVNARRGAQ